MLLCFGGKREGFGIRITGSVSVPEYCLLAVWPLKRHNLSEYQFYELYKRADNNICLTYCRASFHGQVRSKAEFIVLSQMLYKCKCQPFFLWFSLIGCSHWKIKWRSVKVTCCICLPIKWIKVIMSLLLGDQASFSVILHLETVDWGWRGIRWNMRGGGQSTTSMNWFFNTM